jgi:hypothetical protein
MLPIKLFMISVTENTRFNPCEQEFYTDCLSFIPLNENGSVAIERD